MSELALLCFGGFRLAGFVLQDVFTPILIGVNSDDAVNDLGHCSCSLVEICEASITTGEDFGPLLYYRG